MKRFAAILVTLILVSVLGLNVVFAQNAVLRGTITDEESGEILQGANIVLSSKVRQVRGVASDGNGTYELRGIVPGSYTVTISFIGFSKKVLTNYSFNPGQVKTLNVSLSAESVESDLILVTASRGQEKVLDAPASVSIIGSEEVAAQGVMTPIDHLQGTPGVDIVRSGLTQANVVTRGFNNVFSGTLLSLVDNRIARVPSIRFNAYSFIPTNNEDISRMEVVLGPGAALYGPNSANGVLHMITKSPFSSQGTQVSLTGGERSVGMVSFRHASTLNEKVGFKISGQYYQGEDWKFIDPVETTNRNLAIQGGANPATLKIGARDFDTEKLAFDARVDLHPSSDWTVIFNGGFNESNSIELTGLGAGQAVDWRYSYVQSRVLYKNFFFQSFLNKSDAGDTFLLRDGNAIVDKSALWVSQAQHSYTFNDRQNFTYGLDLLLTRPDTEGTINGRNEDNDDINEWGAYIQSKTQLSDMFSVVLAGRFDDHDQLGDPFWSPRAALVFKPASAHTFRATFNRAFETPTTNNLFLDILSSPNLGGLPYGVRVYGAKDGFSFRRDSNGGVGGLYMQSPFSVNPAQHIAADATQIWAGLSTIPGLGALAQIPAPPSGSVGTVLRVLNPTTQEFVQVTPDFVNDIKPLEQTKRNTFEVGYKGVIKNKLLLTLDLWHTEIEDFTGPLRVETPNVFYDPAGLGAYLSNPNFPLTPITVGALTQAIAQIPVGTVTPTDTRNAKDLFLTYRNFGNIDLTGLDFSFNLFINKYLNWSGFYSQTDRDFFNDVAGVSDIALNASKRKFGTTLKVNDIEKGYDGFLRFRFTDGFPVNSGVYVGTVGDYGLVDVNFGYQLPIDYNAKLSLTVQNLFDNKHIEMVGAPQIGRLSLLRLSYGF